MFRRRRSPVGQAAADRSAAPSATTPAGAPGGTKTEGKGRPTPKRREAQPQRQMVRPPQGRREAYRKVKERQRESRRRARAGMAAGEERYLPRREQGPVRKLARDYVDSRRTVGEFFVYFALVCLALTVVPVAWVQLIAYNVAFPLLIAALVVDSVRLSRQVKARVAQRYPGESTRGLSYYAITRGLQIRRLRIPKPAVKVGDRV